MRSRNHKKVEHLRQGFCQPCGPVVWRNSGQRIPPPRLDGECRGLLVLPTGENHEKPVTPACFKQSQQVLSSVDGTSIADVVPPNVRCVVAVQSVEGEGTRVESGPEEQEGHCTDPDGVEPPFESLAHCCIDVREGFPLGGARVPGEVPQADRELVGSRRGGRPAYTPSPGSLHH